MRLNRLPNLARRHVLVHCVPSRPISFPAALPSSRRFEKPCLNLPLWLAGGNKRTLTGQSGAFHIQNCNRRDFSSSSSVKTMAWSHRPCKGCVAVADWGKVFEAANGKRQSPINLTKAEYDEELKGKPLKTEYVDAPKCGLVNTGSSAQVNFPADTGGVSGGPLSNHFEVLQYHFHWGSCDEQGSEHLVDGKSYPIELHIVHWNKEQCKTVETALQHPNGLAVLGIFLEIGRENTELKKITDLFDKVKFKSQKAEIEDLVRLHSLLPKDAESYWNYLGSLTTPPCFESVNWIVFRQPISLSREQMEKFRNLHETAEDNDPAEQRCLVDNYRPVLPIHDRPLHSTFKA